MDVGIFFAFIPAAVLIVITPGPDTVYNLTESLRGGSTAGMCAALGTATGILVHTAAAVLGVATLIRTSATAYQLVKYIGAAYLVYLGIQTLRNDEEFEIETTLGGDDRSYVTSYREAAVINISNPKVAMFVLAFFPQFIPSSANATVLMSILGVIYAGVSIVYFVSVALLADRARSLLVDSDLTQRAIQYGSGSVLVGFGLKLALEKGPTT